MPFELEELIAYIERYLHNSIQQHRVKAGLLELDIKTRVLYSASGSISIKRLSKQEFTLLRLLFIHLGEVISYEDIELAVWRGSLMNNHSLYNYIRKLRQLLTADTHLSLVNLEGQGYSLQLKTD